MAMTLVSTVTVGSGGAASIEFTNIPQTGKDLLLLVSARTAWTADFADTLKVEFNNTTSGYSDRFLRGNGSSAASGTRSFIPNLATNNSVTSNTFGNGQTYISNYTSSATKATSTDAVSENNATTAYQLLEASSSNITSAITSLKIVSEQGSNLLQYSTAALYIIS